MGYRFKRKENVDAGVRRIGSERLQRALSRLKEAEDPLDAVHDVRKDIKKVRALLRLMRHCLPKKVFQREAEILREAAALLAGVRDARVKLLTFQNLIEHFHDQLDEHAFANVRQALEGHCNREGEQFLANNSCAKVRASLRKLERQVEEWRIDDDDWPAVEPGLLCSYRRGRNEHQLVQDKPTADNFHEWRKRVKDLGYQLRLVRGAWPEIIRPTVEVVSQLGEYLGDDHDAAVLKDAVMEGELAGASHEAETLVALIDQRQRELQSCALILGARLYAEKPAQFCGRLGTYWRQWRCEDQKFRENGEVMLRARQVGLAA